MMTRCVFTLLIGAALAATLAGPGAGQTRVSAIRQTDDVSALIAGFQASARARDSLASLADATAGATRDVLEEQIWQHQVELATAVVAAADRIEEDASQGRNVAEARRALGEAVGEEWPRERAQLQRRRQGLAALGGSVDAAAGAQRLAIETEMTRQADRMLEACRLLADEFRALERVDIDVSTPRAYLGRELGMAADGLITRLQLAERDRNSAAARYSRETSNTALMYESEAAEERFKRASRGLATAIVLMDRLGLETTNLRVALITTTGRITTDIFRGQVLLGVLKTLGAQLSDFLAAKAPQWLFRGLLVVLTFFGFRALAEVVRRGVRAAVKYSQFSGLMRATLVRLCGNGIMLIGFLVILTQLGVRVAPLLAGLGIAGFAVGFAMQNTLSNFAAGGMILGNQPFDVGDEIEVAGVLGVVKRMSLVSTTILTPDNQTLIVPNSTIWGGVIRNRTAQPIRRVDLTFAIGYGDDLEKAERVLQEIVAAQEGALTAPAPTIKLHQLGDSSVVFAVRVWTAKERYWDVYWDLTRAVKLRFDQEGISIPFPQRELHVNLGTGGSEGVAALGGAPRHA